MKYYSEVTDKVYDSEEELKTAEEEALKEEKASSKEGAEKSAAAVSCDKKALSKCIEDAEEKLDKAYRDYELVVKDAQAIIDEADKKARELLNPAKEAIAKAQREKYEAISNFNEKYGTYTTILTGNKAYNEYQRILNSMEHFDRLFDKFFWF